MRSICRSNHVTLSMGLVLVSLCLGTRAWPGGVLMGPGSVTYTNASIRGGFYPAGTLIKVRQTQQITEMRKLKR